MTDTPTQTTRECIIALLAAFEAEDIDKITDLVADDAVWHFPGRNGRLVGAHRGREGILSFLGNVRALTNNTFHLEPEALLCEGDIAVMLFKGTGTRNNKQLNNPTCLRIRVEHGKFKEAHEFVWDLYAVDEFWS